MKKRGFGDVLKEKKPLTCHFLDRRTVGEESVRTMSEALSDTSAKEATDGLELDPHERQIVEMMKMLDESEIPNIISSLAGDTDPEVEFDESIQNAARDALADTILGISTDDKWGIMDSIESTLENLDGEEKDLLGAIVPATKMEMSEAITLAQHMLRIKNERLKLRLISSALIQTAIVITAPMEEALAQYHKCLREER